VSNVWRIPILTDRPATWADATRITSERAYIEFVDVSTDGQQLAVSSDRRGNQDLWLLPSSGGEMTPLTTDPAPDWNPRWSPGGTEIAFYSYRSGNRDIWVMPARGGPARQLTNNPGSDFYPSWSPIDGREILFRASRGGESGVWTVPSTGGDARRLTTGPTGSAEWSPDGQWLVVSRQGKLLQVSKEGKELAVFPTTGSLVPNTSLVSSDGHAIYFAHIDEPIEAQRHWKLSLADGKLSPLTTLEGDAAVSVTTLRPTRVISISPGMTTTATSG
jgi:Tol biopolymer transport system component